MNRAIRRLTPALLLVAGVFVMLVDYANLRAIPAADQPTGLSELSFSQPWGGYAWRTLSRRSGDAAVLDAGLAAEVLATAATRYPLDATQWLDLAQIHVDEDRPEATQLSLDKALATQPNERESLWRAAQIALQTDRPDIAERQFRRWLRQYRYDVGQALFIGSRWIEDPGELIDRMLPEGREYLVEAMKVAEQRRDTDLALAVWDRMDPKPGLGDRAFVDFVEQLLTSGRVDQAVALWAEQDPYFRPGDIANGAFSREPGYPAGLNWVLAAPAAIRMQRDLDDFASEPASLQIRFNAKENVNLARPMVRIPVEPGRRYRISGMWKAEGLTTRSLPYWSVNVVRGEALRVPGRTFGWQRWAFEFDVPETTRLIGLVLRREQTDAFDRNIGGTLWIDDVAIEPVLSSESGQAASADD